MYSGFAGAEAEQETRLSPRAEAREAQGGLIICQAFGCVLFCLDTFLFLSIIMTMLDDHWECVHLARAPSEESHRFGWGARPCAPTGVGQPSCLSWKQALWRRTTILPVMETG
jgi:hypothetical protein